MIKLCIKNFGPIKTGYNKIMNKKEKILKLLNK